MPSNDDQSDQFILQRARERALALLDALNRDADPLRSESNTALSEGAALCEQAAAETRRVIAALDAELSGGEDAQP